VKSSGLNTALILKEQPDKGEAIMHISLLLEKIAMLWQIPNWTANNSVLLAEWVYDTYQYDSMETVLKCLKNPPVDNDPKAEKNWRLSPDLIQKWMLPFLEKDSMYRETSRPKNEEVELSYKPIFDWPCALSPVKNKEARKRIWEKLLNDLSRQPRLAIRPLSPNEVVTEGGIEPAKKIHYPTDRSFLKQHKEKVIKGRVIYFRENFPDATEKDLQAYLASFPEIKI
jgi:hypothetical protein